MMRLNKVNLIKHPVRSKKMDREVADVLESKCTQGYLQFWILLCVNQRNQKRIVFDPQTTSLRHRAPHHMLVP